MFSTLDIDEGSFDRGDVGCDEIKIQLELEFKWRWWRCYGKIEF